MPFKTLPLLFALAAGLGPLSTLAAPMTDATPAPVPAAASAAPFPHAEWSRQATIYEVNVRQHSAAGTLKAVEADLPRLKSMGIDIVWLMPLQPIGVKNRKGTLGSYYAIRDYTAVNPEFGTLEDVRHLVRTAHGLGLKVILDWVANHTAWDHPWATQHDDWYKKNAKGEIFPVTFTNGPEPEYWTDVIGLNYENRALWKGMTDAMAFWVRETDLDGFRCDVAGLVPTAFWEQARAELDAIKPMFMLAEWSEPELHAKAFDMTYNWELADLMKKIAQGQADARDLRAYVAKPTAKPYPADAYRMAFTSNHDFNSWQGSDTELYGAGFRAFATLAATLPGMPLVYSGQESGLDKRLEFFEKDPVAWKGYALQGFYTGLLALKKRLPALANGARGAPVQLIETGDNAVFAFRRELAGHGLVVVANLSAQPRRVSLPGEAAPRELPAWGHTVTEF